MAYVCPVCAEPQVDAAHLANHVAFTAITGDDAHEEWLDATVGHWGQLGQDELAEIVVEHAEGTEFPVDGADVSAGNEHGHGHDASHEHSHERGRQQGRPPSAVPPSGDLDDETQDVIADARELTRQMEDGEGDVDGEDEGGSEDDDGGKASDGDRSNNETQ